MTSRRPLISFVFTADWATAEQGWGGSYFQRVWPKQGELDKVLPFCLMPEFPKNSLELVYFLPSKDNKLSYKEFCVMMNRKRRPSTSSSREVRLLIDQQMHFCHIVVRASYVSFDPQNQLLIDWILTRGISGPGRVLCISELSETFKKKEHVELTNWN